MLSGQVGRYRYYEIEDMYKSAGCKACAARTRFHNNIFLENPKDQHEECIRCSIFMAVKLTKIYAEQLADYEERYIDDGR